MKKVIKFGLFAFILLQNFVLFAQPSDGDNNGDLEGGDTPPTPINGKLVILLVMAIVYAVYVIKYNRKRVY